MIREAEIHAALAWAMRQDQADELAKLRMQLLRYRAFIEQHDLEPPDQDGADLLQMWRDCRAVIAAAHECVANLGTSKELLSNQWS